MYKIKNTKVLKIVELLESKGLVDDNENFVKFLDTFCDDIDLYKLVEVTKAYTKQCCEDYHALLKKEGCLTISPKIIGEEDDIPSLRICEGRYLHWFRGYYFQISNTADGLGCFNNSCFRLDDLLYMQKKAYLPDSCKSFTFVMAALTTLLYMHTGVADWLQTESGRAVLNEFLRITDSETDRIADTELDVQDVLKYINVTASATEPVILCDDAACVLSYKDVRHTALVKTDNFLIAVVHAKYNEWLTYSLRYPEWLRETKDFDKEKLDSFKKAILEFFLTYIGIHTSYMIVRPDPEEYNIVRSVNYTLPKTLTEFSQVAEWFVE